jgi:phosphopantothenoylcysteine synthetase/decarboxylase
MARLLLGVSGGIAAYKALEVVRLATKAGHAVRAIQTPTAQKFVGAASFAALTAPRSSPASSSAIRRAARSPTRSRRRTIRPATWSWCATPTPT